MPLSAVLRLSIDIFCLRGTQQQTRRTPLLTSIDVTDRRTVASIPGGGEGGDCLPPIKIYLGESIFSPPQSFS